MQFVKKIVVVMAMLALLSGCQTIEVHKAAPQYSVGVVLKALDSPYWRDMQSGMEQAAVDYGMDMILLYPEGEKEEEEQEKLIADVIDSRVDLLLVAPCNSYDTSWMVEKAEKQDVAILAVDTKALDCSLPYIGSDNYMFGRLIAEYFNTQFEDDAEILLMFGPENQSSIIERYQGISDHLNPGIQIKDAQYMELKEEYGFQLIEQMEEPVDGIFCQNSVLARGAIEALAEKGWDAKIAAVDTREDAMQILQDEVMDAFIVQDGYEIGYRAIEAAVTTLKTGETPKEDLLFEGSLLTLENKEEQHVSYDGR